MRGATCRFLGQNFYFLSPLFPFLFRDMISLLGLRQHAIVLFKALYDFLVRNTGRRSCPLIVFSIRFSELFVFDGFLIEKIETLYHQVNPGYG